MTEKLLTDKWGQVLINLITYRDEVSRVPSEQSWDFNDDDSPASDLLERLTEGLDEETLKSVVRGGTLCLYSSKKLTVESVSPAPTGMPSANLSVILRCLLDFKGSGQKVRLRFTQEGQFSGQSAILKVRDLASLDMTDMNLTYHDTEGVTVLGVDVPVKTNINVECSLTKWRSFLESNTCTVSGDIQVTSPRVALEKQTYSYNLMDSIHDPKRTLGDEKPDFFGVELEVNCERSVAQVIPAFDKDEERSNPFAAAKGDGSITGEGFEIVTTAATLEYHREAWSRFFDKVDHLEEGNISLGLHVHACRDFLSRNDVSMRTVSEFLKKVENFKYLLVFSERTQATDYFGPERPWTSLNIGRNICSEAAHGQKTFEFRMFNSIPYYEGVIKAIEFCKALVEFLSVNGEYSTFKDFCSWVDKDDYPVLHEFIEEAKEELVDAEAFYSSIVGFNDRFMSSPMNHKSISMEDYEVLTELFPGDISPSRFYYDKEDRTYKQGKRVKMYRSSGISLSKRLNQKKKGVA